MPMRQPCGSSAPACSPATSSGVVPSASTSLPLASEAGRGRRPRRRRPRRRRGGSARGSVARAAPARSKRSVSASSRPAGPQAQVSALAPVGHAPVQLGDVPPAVPIVVVLVQRVARMVARERAQITAEDRVLGRRGEVHVRGVGQAARSPGERSQHPHHRRHAAAGRDEQQRMLERLAEGRTPRSAARAGPACPRRAWLTRCSDTSPPGMRLTVMAMRPSRAPRHRRERVGAPVANAVDVDADAHVLARHVRGPATAGPQPQRHAVARLGHHGFDAAARLQRVDQSGFSWPR